MSTTAQVTVYTRKGCVACMATFRALTKAAITYEAIDTTCNKRPSRTSCARAGRCRCPWS